MERFEHFRLHAVHHQMELPRGELPQGRHGALGIPQGSGVGGGNDHSTIGDGGSQQEAVAQARRGIHQAEVVLLADLTAQRLHPVHIKALVVTRQRGSQQLQLCVFAVLRHCFIEAAASRQHVGEVHRRAVAETQRHVEIAQRNVAIQRQRPVSHFSQCDSHAGGKGGFSRASLAGDYGDDRTHSVSPYFNGAFLIFAQGRGNWGGVGRTFSMTTTRCTTSLSGMA